jgi:hypothetical protein
MINDTGIPRKALRAAEAGAYLADRIGLPAAIAARQMWHYARTGVLPAVRLGRHVWFQTDALDAFGIGAFGTERGGTP